MVRRLCETTSKPSYVASLRKMNFNLDVLWQFFEESNARHSNQLCPQELENFPN